MLADPGLLVAEAIEVLDQRQVAVNGFGRILFQGMEGREEDAVTQVGRTASIPIAELLGNRVLLLVMLL